MEGRNDDVRNSGSSGQERKEQDMVITIVVRLMISYNSRLRQRSRREIRSTHWTCPVRERPPCVWPAS